MDEIYNDLSPLKRKQQILADLERMQKQEKQGTVPKSPQKGPAQKKSKSKKNAFSAKPEWDNGGIEDEPEEPVEKYEPPQQHELLKNEKRSIIDNDVIVLTKKQQLQQQYQ